MQHVRAIARPRAMPKRRARVPGEFEAMRSVRTLGLLGTGVIGGGWAARALHFGIDVIAADSKPEMEQWIRGRS